MLGEAAQHSSGSDFLVNEARPSTRESRLGVFGGAALLALLLVLAWLPVWQADFIWDDTLDFQLTPPIHLGASLYRIWCTTSLADYYPITWTVCLLESWCFGTHPLGYHLVNLFIHIIAVMLLWRVLSTLRCPYPWLASLTFGVHPLTVASVAWACEIKNTLSFVFYALTLLFYLRQEEAGRPRLYFALALGSFIVAVLCKTSGVGLPLFMLGCRMWTQGRLRRRDGLEIVPFVAVAVAISCVGIWFQTYRAIGDDIASTDDFLTRLAAAGSSFWFYVEKSLWPTHLMMIYPDPAIAVHSALTWGPDAALVAGLALAAWGRRTAWGRSLLFAFLYVLLMLAPVLGFVDMAYMRFARVADQFAYLALAGVVALYVAGVAAVARRLQFRAAACTFAVVAVGTLAVLTWQQTRLYRDPEIFWADNLRQNPDAWVVWANMGQYLSYVGRFADAVPYFDHLVTMRPQDNRPWYDRGVALMRCGRLTEAMSDFRQAIALRPMYGKAHNNLAIILQQLHREDDALREYILAINSDPTLTEACDNAANILARRGRLEEAHTLYERAVTIDPRFAEGWCNLGAFLADRGGSEAALKCYQKALEIDPKFVAVYNNEGVVLSRLGRIDEAIAAFKTAARLDPRHPDGYNAVGTLEAQLGHVDAAVKWFGRAIAVDPAYVTGYNNLALMYATASKADARNGARAVEMALRANDISGGRIPSILHTLALSYAADGRFANAIRTDQRARVLARAAGNTRLVESIDRSLVQFRAGQPVNP